MRLLAICCLGLAGYGCKPVARQEVGNHLGTGHAEHASRIMLLSRLNYTIECINDRCHPWQRSIHGTDQGKFGGVLCKVRCDERELAFDTHHKIFFTDEQPPRGAEEVAPSLYRGELCAGFDTNQTLTDGVEFVCQAMAKSYLGVERGGTKSRFIIMRENIGKDFCFTIRKEKSPVGVKFVGMFLYSSIASRPCDRESDAYQFQVRLYFERS